VLEYNDSGVFEQVFYSQLDVAQDRREKTRTNSLARMNRDGSGSSVLMPQKNVAATGSNDLEIDSFQGS